MAKNGETNSAEFVRWYVATFRDIHDGLAGTGVDGVPRQEMAGQILNALLFLGFTRVVLPHRKGVGAEGFIETTFLNQVISVENRCNCPVAILNRVSRAIDLFSFSLADDGGDPSRHIVSPGMLDEASEALSRKIAGEEKIASRGTFYTRQVEILFMCKVVISRFLQGKFPLIPREKLERLVFGAGDREPNKKLAPFAPEGETRHIIDALFSLKVLDPACGSGAFLTGMAATCHDIISRLASADRQLALDPELIARKLVMAVNGVDNDALAVQVAKIRVYLWYLNFFNIHDAPIEHVDLPVLDNTIKQADFFWFQSSGDARPLDIVIGNPPYIRQEDIKPSRINSSLPARDEKDRYKEALLDELKRGSPSTTRLSRTCDLYVYFFIKAVQVLRNGGELCFITSNTWLDAKFGRELHAFLLEAVSGLSIFDFSERSFDRAEINTVITACTRHNNADDVCPYVSFVHFKIPPDRIRAVPSGAEAKTFDSTDARLVVMHKDDLISDGKRPGNDAREKWRVQYLNEHEIFYTVQRKAAGKVVPIGSIASVKAGCYSGINDFFYVDRQTIDRFGIEAEYLHPLLRSARNVRSLSMDVPEGNFLVVIPPVTKEALKNRGHHGVLSYITWGEAQSTKRGQKTATGIPWPLVESVRHRTYWYSLNPGNTRPARLLMQYIAHDRFYCPWSEEAVVPDRCFHRIEPFEGIDLEALAAVLNSTLQAFIVMVTGRVGLGGGALKLEALDAKSMNILDPRILTRDTIQDLARAIQILGRRGPLPLNQECGLTASKPFPDQSPSPKPDRAALDDIVFDVLGLNVDERKDVYRATCSAISNRLKKARPTK